MGASLAGAHIAVLARASILLPVQAQTDTLADRPSCATCQIIIGPRSIRVADPERVVTGVGRSLAAVGPAHFATGGRGAPVLFDRSGQPVRALGGTGAGPREFSAATAFAVGPGDSLAVYDGPNGRISVFDSGFRFVRDFRIDQAAPNKAVAWLSDGRFAVSSLRASERSIGLTVHLFSTAGAFIKSMAESRRPIGAESSQLQASRLLQELPGGKLLTVTHLEEYVVQVWDLASGRLLRELRRAAPWFAERAGPFVPRMSAIMVDSSGRLWTLIAVPSPTWERGVRPRLIAGVEKTYDIIDSDLVLDSVIEVIDLAAGVLLAQLRTSRVYKSLLPGGLLAAEADEGPVSGYDLFPVAHRQ
jgi:hypothetical protein